MFVVFCRVYMETWITHIPFNDFTGTSEKNLLSQHTDMADNIPAMKHNQ